MKSNGPVGDINLRKGCVFLNFPFDNEYKKLLEALIFSVIYCGFRPRCALEKIDSSVGRLEKIVGMIKDSSSSIHDISRHSANVASIESRFNMPFELGLFLGCKFFGSDLQENKTALVLDVRHANYRDVLSDLSGYDISCHNNEQSGVIRSVRDFLAAISSDALPGTSYIQESYDRFSRSRPQILAELKLSLNDLTYNDLVNCTLAWCHLDEARPKSVSRAGVTELIGTGKMELS